MKTEQYHRKCHRYGSMLKYLDGLKFCRWQILWALLTGLLTGISSGFGIPMLLKYLANEVFMGDRIVPCLLFYYCVLPFLLISIRTISGFLNTYLLTVIGQEILKSIRLKIFQKIHRLPLSFFHRTSSGDVISRAANDVNIIQSCFVSIAHEILQRPITLISGMCAVVFLCLQETNGWMMLIILILVGLSAIPIIIFGRQVWVRNLQAQEKIAQLTSRLTTNLSTVQEVRAFGIENHEVNNYRRANNDYSKTYISACKSYYSIVPSIELWAAVGIGISMCYGYYLHIPGDTFLAIGTALFLVYDPVKNIGRLYGNLQCSFSALSRIESLLSNEEIPAMPEKPIRLDHVRGDIIFDGITFAYEPDRPLFRQFSISLEAGKGYAIVGPSGAGKSTLANLLLRFYELEEGAIYIDDVDIARVSTDNLRKNIAFVSQSTTLINGSIYENVLCGKRNATKKEVERAIQCARIDDFVEQLPHGIYTIIGENGLLLSGGQRQRVAIARAFLRNAPILILDEVTSALDNCHEAQLYESMKLLFHNRTVILISHRFNLLPMMDEIIVLHAGCVIQRGTHEKLSSQEGLYKRLHLAHHG
ncbi:MAG: ABC transporter ATP-binding protein/permease [Puniceicoccales bacterium]|nr:ABC transporter ATP-binding protein/permease [Puniceicoccales bacterium]